MRRGLLVLLLPAFALAGGEGNQGEKLYRDLEKTITTAKTVHIKFASKVMKGTKEAGHFKGVVDLGEGDKASVEVKGEMEGKDFSLKMTSDGKMLKAVVTPSGEGKEEPLPKNFGKMVRSALARVGPTGALLMSRHKQPGAEEQDLDKLLRISDFKLGADAKGEGRGARVIEYKVAIKDADTITMKLWLDAKSQLPLKRELAAEKEGENIRIVETYSEFSLGKKKSAGLEPLKPSTSAK
jgi:hypothetical protein